MNLVPHAVLSLAFVLFSVSPGYAVEVDCAYDANEEWPLADGRTCQIRVEARSLLLSDTPIAASKHPACLDASSDPDGDGWGWENSRSCVVQSKGSTHPVCANRASDPDGDGWGWENHASCVVKYIKVDPHPDCEFRRSDPDGDGWGYEHNRSCLITENSLHSVCSGDVTDHDNDGWGYENGDSCKVVKVKEDPEPGAELVLEQTFDGSPRGVYTGARLNSDWNTPLWHLGFNQGRAHIVSEAGRGNALRITFPANAYGAAGASAFLSDLQFAADLPRSYEELYVSYDVKFGKGFDFVRGGKLPGLCGHDNTKSPATGCNSGGGFPSGFDGWSARGMWREDGVMENYVYHSAQENFYGDDEYWQVKAKPGQWHQIQHHVVLNTAGKADGVLEAWFDGRQVLSESTFVYRKTDNIGINLFYFSTFFGGNDPSWAPSTDQFVYFDNIRISTTPIE